MDDIQLAKAISDGDQVAFKLLFERYYQPLLAYISTFTNDPAQSEDIVQQAFIMLWKNRKKLRIYQSPKNYLYTAAYNTYIDQFRKSKRENKFIDDLKREALQSKINDDTETSQERIAKLNSIVKTLPERCREILSLNKLQGMKYREIAELLGISIKTVESQMRIAYKKIREGFEED